MGTDAAAASDAGPRAPGGRLARIVPWLVLLALICHPTQVTVRQWADAFVRLTGIGGGLAARIPGVGICVSDALFVLAFGLWVIVNLPLRRLISKLRTYPLALAVLLACALLSVVPFLKPSDPFTGRRLVYGRAVKELAQLFILLGCTYIVLADCLRDERWRKRLVTGFLVAAGLAVLIGLAEYARLRPAADPGSGWTLSPLDVDGTFGFRAVDPGAHEQIGTNSNRNVLGAWAGLVVPLFWALALCLKRPPLKAACGVAAIAGLPLLLTGGLWLAAMVGVLTVASLPRGKAFALTAVGLLLVWGVLFRFGPQQHGMVLLDSVMLRRTQDRYRTLPLYTGTETAVPAALAEDDNSVWQQKFVEWQPGLQAAARTPLFGVGVGNYQPNINVHYELHADPLLNPDGAYRIAKPSANLMEAGANAFYLVWLVETGFVGILAFLWVLQTGLRSSADGFARAHSGLERGLALGSLGALVTVSIGSIFASYMVRGVGIALVFVLAVALSRPAPSAEDA